MATIDDLKVSISELMAKKGVKNYELDFYGNATKGDSYLTEISFVSIIGTLPDSSKTRYNLVVKTAKKSDEFRKQTPVKESFEREVFMYQKIFPVFREFQSQCGVEDAFQISAHFYGACQEYKKETLILDNLKIAGYDVHDRKLPQNLDHVRLVFQSYGKFHAISIALKQKRPELFRHLTKDFTDALGYFVYYSQMAPGCIAAFNDGVNALKKNGKEEIARKFDGFSDHVKEYLMNYTNPYDESSAILHGDCWSSNIMFKYKEGDKRAPVDVRLIDFQLSRVASPVFDLSYYLYTCADKKVLDHFDLLLETYHSSLSSYLDELGCDSYVLPLNRLRDHWRKYGKFGISLAPLLLKLQHCESDEVLDYAAFADKGDVAGAFDFSLKMQDVYEQRLVDVFMHFAEKFL